MTEPGRRPQSPLPVCLNLGSGKDVRDDCLNIDVNESFSPDAICDLSKATGLASGIRLETRRFGQIMLRPGMFDKIIANDVLEHVPDLMAMMTSCLSLLRTGGHFEISVPYDLSYGAWQDPTHVRAFNERSWLYYTDWFWYMGWSDFRFEIASFNFVPSPFGEALRAKGHDREDILRTPRAIDSMHVVLRKVALSAEDRTVFAFHHGAKPAKSRITATEPMTRPAFDGTWLESRDRYCLWIVTPESYTHQQAYDDFASGLSAAFTGLGGSAPVIRDAREAAGRDLIILGPQLLPPGAASFLTPNSILFNLEQADRASPWMSESYFALLRQRPVLDYSVKNLAALRLMGVPHARLLPPGYAPSLARVTPSATRDIDVLFYGCLNARRSAIIEALKSHGLNVVSVFGVYGAQRDLLIARSKIVLNLHFYESAIFESIRVSFLLANGACVVSEGEADDPDIAPYRDGLATVSYGDIVNRCLALLAHEAERERLAASGVAAAKARPQAGLLRALFEPAASSLSD